MTTLIAAFRIFTKAPAFRIFTKAPAFRIFTKAPAFRIFTKAPAFRIFTKAPTRFLQASYIQISEHSFQNLTTVEAVSVYSAQNAHCTLILILYGGS